MPWQEVCIMSLRRDFIELASSPEANIRELCRRFEISPKTGYKWLARYRAEGLDGLRDRSRKPRSSPAKTSDTVEQSVLDLRASHPAWGGRKLRQRLLNQGHVEVPSASTITEILRRHEQLGRRAGLPQAVQRFERPEPNQLWQLDFKGHIPLARGRCHPLTVLDDHARYAVGLFACADERLETVQTQLIIVFRRYGLPDHILCDNGPPWGSAGGPEPHTGLTVWLLRLGIGVSHGRAYHPQTQGKDERFHRTLVVEVLQGQLFADLAVCQRRFDAWRAVYNHERPHEALGLAVPASRYRPSRRSYPEVLPALEYGTGDIVRRVDANGRLMFRGRPWKVGKPFAGQSVGLRPTVEDGVWAVYFGVHRIGSVDLRTDPEQR
jgi:transposase InsO family protein